MSRKLKSLIEKDFASCFNGVDEMIVISLRGVEGNDNNEFRGALLEKGIKVKVVKNSIASRAFESAGATANMNELFSGPCAIVYGGEGVVNSAKELVDWTKKIKSLEIKGGYMEGQILDAKQAEDVAKMLTRSEQQGEIVMIAMTPGANVVGAATSPAATIAGCLKTIIDNGEAA